jgi:REP element-mobilizing transposase RayT
MSERYKTFKGGYFFVTMSVMGWIDVFSRADYCDILEENLNFCINNKGLKVYCYCIMTNHVHLIASAEKGLLSDLLRDYKSYTAKVIIKEILENPQESRKEWLEYMFKFFAKPYNYAGDYHFWQYGNHSIVLDTAEIIEQKVDYIHQNPVRARMVNEAQNYIFSSANPFCKVKITDL